MESTEAWKELAHQVPGLCVLVLLVVMFVKSIATREQKFMDYLGTLDASQSERMRIRDESLKLLGQNCHTFQHDLAERNEQVMGKVSRALDRNSEAFTRNSVVLDRIEKQLEIK
jgi:hypothetical protein